ncbi:MAG TPA: ABC transporter ATP-binding protein [Acidimicrobiales bacterium]|nr:ABC transporter ATP-binding protein [Acidimicrobiales bacterium]
MRRLVALQPRWFAFGVAGAVVYAFATVASSWVLGRVVDRVITPRFESGHVGDATVWVGAALIFAVGVVKAAGIVARRVGATNAKFGCEAILREQVVAQYQRLPLAWHQAHASGELLAHAGADAQAATNVLGPLPYATGVLTMLVLATAWMFATDVSLALVAIVLLPILLVLNVSYQRRVHSPNFEAQNQIGDVSAIAHESFDGALVVKALGAEDAETERFGAAAEELRAAKVRSASVQASFTALLDAVPSIGTIAVLVVGAWRVESGAITAGTLVALVNLLTLLLWPLRLIGYVLYELSWALAGMDRLDAVLDEPVPALPAHPRRLAPGHPMDVRVDHLTFCHEPTSATLADVTFTIRPGATVALVGPTGSGKTTLLLLLARLLDPMSGSISIGGVDLSQLAADDLTAQVALVFQEPFLFGTTVAENIVLDGPGSREDAVTAAALARADDFVRNLPAGYDTVIGERGATLSGGQRQRLALARALVRRPGLLLLDDATSAVDPATEFAILDGLRDHLRTTTTVMVATRPSTIALADEVLFLDHGQLAGRGSHAHLLATVPGYSRLVRAYEKGAAA